MLCASGLMLFVVVAEHAIFRDSVDGTYTGMPGVWRRGLILGQNTGGWLVLLEGRKVLKYVHR